MQGRYINTIFYIFIITCVVCLGIGSVYRYKADIYFDTARKIIPHYARTNEGLQHIQYYYNMAAKNNPLDKRVYADMLNGNFLREVGRAR